MATEIKVSVTEILVSVAVIATIAFLALKLYGCPDPPRTNTRIVTVRDRNDSIRIYVQAMTITDMDAELATEKKRRVDTEWTLGKRDATVRILQSIIDTLQSADDTSATVSIPTFSADTVTAKNDTVIAKLEFSPTAKFSIEVRLSPIDTAVVAHDSLLTEFVPVASPAELGVGTLGGILMGVGAARDNRVVMVSGVVVMSGLVIYEWFK